MKKSLALVLIGVMPFSNLLTGSYAALSAEDVKIIYGDVNNDGNINVLDMIMLKSYIAENNKKDFSLEAADVDNDGEVSECDLMEVSMYLLNQIPTFSYVLETDSDNDGLCDYIEKEILKTNHLSADTDGDGLNDYEEVYFCGTDPLKKDVVTDELKDIDGDGLSNSEEIKIGTNPLCSDTDGDGLSDYDEVKKYKTDPKNSDTDGDGISDSGEIALGTDANKNSSSEIFEQKLDSDSLILSKINSVESPYKVSVSMNASGYVNEAIDIRESVYSVFLEEEEILGNIIDINYDSRFNVESLDVTFELKGISNIKDYMIFEYEPSVTMLLPVKTEYDGNKLTVTNTNVGTFCVVNVVEISEKNKLISELEESIEITPISASINDMAVYDIVSPNKDTTNIYCQFILDDSTCSVKSWSDISEALITATKKLEKNGYELNMKLEFIAYGYAVNISCSDSARLKTICDTATAFFNDSSVNSINSAYNYYVKMKSNNESDVWSQLSTYYTPSFNHSHSYDTVLLFNSNSSKNKNVCAFNVGESYCNVYNIYISAFNKSVNNIVSNFKDSSDKIYKVITFKDDLKGMVSYTTSLFGKTFFLINSSNKSELMLSEKTKLSKVVSKSKNKEGGAEQFSEITGIDIGDKEAVPMKSDPMREDSDGDGIPDPEDARPLEKFDDRFCLSDKNYINITNKNIYNLKQYADSIYNTRTSEDDGVPQSILNNMKVRAYGNAMSFLLFPNASKFLRRFLENTGETLWYDAKSVLKTKVGYNCFAENMNIVRDLCETTVVNKLCFLSDYNAHFCGAAFSSIGGNTRKPVDWWLSIGNAEATMSISCQREGNEYIAEIEYNILDFYDWEEGSTDFGGLVVDGEMFLLHVHGMAREMETIGQYYTTMKWKKGDRLSLK